MRDRERVVLRIESLASGRLGDEHLPAVCLFQKTGSIPQRDIDFRKQLRGKFWPLQAGRPDCPANGRLRDTAWRGAWVSDLVMTAKVLRNSCDAHRQLSC